MEQLIIGRKAIAYEIVTNSRAKRIIIKVIAGKVKVTQPKGTSIREVKKFVKSQQNWILSKLESYDQLEKQKKKYITGEDLLYRGELYPIKIATADNKKVTVSFKNNTFLVGVPKVLINEKWPREEIKEALTRWFKQQACQVLKEKLDYYSALMSLSYNQMRIKDQKTRWGSCSTKKNINLNWRIILAADDVIDYLIVHELAHLSHMNHSQEFWALVAMYSPGYRQHKRWLREEGKHLTIDS